MSYERQRPASRQQRGDSEEYRKNSSSRSHSSSCTSGNKWGNAAASAERGERPGRAWEEEERMNDVDYLQSETKKVQSESRDSTRRALAR